MGFCFMVSFASILLNIRIAIRKHEIQNTVIRSQTKFVID